MTDDHIEVDYAGWCRQMADRVDRGDQLRPCSKALRRMADHIDKLEDSASTEDSTT